MYYPKNESFFSGQREYETIRDGWMFQVEIRGAGARMVLESGQWDNDKQS